MHKKITISPKQAKNNFVKSFAKSCNDYTLHTILHTRYQTQTGICSVIPSRPDGSWMQSVQFSEFFNNSRSSLHCDSVVPVLEYLVLS